MEVQILLSAGVPSPAGHLLSNHYNQTRREYLNQLRMASESGGKVLPFLTYALDGFVESLRSQLVYVRKLQMESAWLNYVHDFFRFKRKPQQRRDRKICCLISFNLTNRFQSQSCRN